MVHPPVPVVKFETDSRWQRKLAAGGTAVYMTSYTRKKRDWENNIEARKWLYQTPEEILIKASNGASDFGNKFGQPLINGSLLTFEHEENDKNIWLR